MANGGAPNQVLTSDGSDAFSVADAAGGSHDSSDVALGDLDGDGSTALVNTTDLPNLNGNLRMSTPAGVL